MVLVLILTSVNMKIGFAAALMAPTPVSPGISSNTELVYAKIDGLNPTLTWRPVEGANNYSIGISEYPYGHEHLIYEEGYIYATSFRVPDGVSEYGKKYRWNMQAHNSNNSSLTSAVSSSLYFRTKQDAVQQPTPTPAIIPQTPTPTPVNEDNNIKQIKTTEEPWGTAKWNSSALSGQSNTGIYKFALTTKGILTVKISGSSSIKVSLFNSAQSSVLRDFGNIGTNNQILKQITLDPGEYYIQLFGSGNCTISTEFETQHLLKTSWNQYEIFFNKAKDNPLTANILKKTSDKSAYVPGCTAVAVGQLINYYLSNGYYDKGWLNIMLKDIDVFPRFTTDIDIEGTLKKYHHKGFTNRKAYANSINENDFTSSDAVGVRTFLFNVAVGLDAQFIRKSSFTETAVGKEYFKDKDKTSNVDKIARLLESRFGFASGVLENKKGNEVKRLDSEKEYIIRSINGGNPVLLGISDSKQKVGHSVVIDSYKVDSKGVFSVGINFGWGNYKKTNEAWYPCNGSFMDASKAYNWDKFYVYKNTIPKI